MRRLASAKGPLLGEAPEEEDVLRWLPSAQPREYHAPAERVFCLSLFRADIAHSD